MFAAGAFEAGASVFAAGAVFAFASVAGAAVFAFASGASTLAGASVAESGLADSTDMFPVNAGIDNNRAESINVQAAVIVIFDKTVAVPRGENAELDTLLVKSAPASVFPGCKRTAATKTRHEIKNKPYKK